MKLEENGTLSLKVIYEPKSLSFKTLFLGGHLLENQKTESTKFKIPRGRIAERRNAGRKRPMEENADLISFDFVYFEGASLKLYYVGFSRQQSGISERLTL